MKKTKIKILASALILSILVICAAGAIIYMGKGRMAEYEASIEDMQAEMNANQKMIYVANRDITAGEELYIGDNLSAQKLYTGLAPSYYITEDDVGSIAVVDIEEGAPVMKNMISALNVESDTREYEIAVASLMTDQAENDYVDVRIMFPNGEDFTILSKKPVKNLSLENAVFYTYLNEDEILRMASATIDAFTVSGTRIYTTRYIATELQEGSKPNYLVKPETIDLVAKDPNITTIAKEALNLQARMDFEDRLLGLSDDVLKAVTNGSNLIDTAKNSVLLGQNTSSSSFYVEEDYTDSKEDDKSKDNNSKTTVAEEKASETNEQDVQSQNSTSDQTTASTTPENNDTAASEGGN